MRGDVCLRFLMVVCVLVVRWAPADAGEGARGSNAPQQSCSNEACHGDDVPAGPWPLPCTLQQHLGFPPASAFGTKRPFVVASFLKWFDVQGFDADEIAHCSVPCLFLYLPSGVGESCVEMADLVLMTSSVTPPHTSVKLPWQLWGYYSLESSAIYTHMDDPGSNHEAAVHRCSPLRENCDFPAMQQQLHACRH